MAATSTKKRGVLGGATVPSLLLRLGLLMLFDAVSIWFGWQLAFSGIPTFAIMLAVVVVAINVFFLRDSGMPLRWIMPALAFMAMMHIYPVLFTVYTAFTNYSDGHLIAKDLAIQQIEAQTYLPENALTFSWTPYSAPDGSYGLWLTSQDGQQFFVTSTGEEFSKQQLEGQGTQFDGDGNPVAVGNFVPVPLNQKFAILSALQPLSFGLPEKAIKISSPSTAAQAAAKYRYDEQMDAMIDQAKGTIYLNRNGTFTSDSGEELIPGFPVTIGFENFKRLFTNPAYRGPLVIIFIWTFVFAFFSVFTTFALGLLIALVLNDPIVPARRAIRVLMIVPYAIPAFVGILIWRGMFNPVLGFIGTQFNPGWFSSPFWGKIAILIINLWLGYSYMFLITTGALQGIPNDIYEAAKVDGAAGLYRFWRITLPLLLVAVGPLLIGSFAFNFNNFTIIDLYNRGGPPIPNTPAPAGYTDILISYTYRLAFGGGRGADYGLAAAVAVIIFIIVGAITIANFRFTGMLEEVSENA